MACSLAGERTSLVLSVNSLNLLSCHSFLLAGRDVVCQLPVLSLLLVSPTIMGSPFGTLISNKHSS